MNKTIIKIRNTSTNIRIHEYFTWIKDILRWQNEGFDITIILLDLQNLLRFKSDKLAGDRSYDIVASLSSAGINFNKVNVVFQSRLSEIQECANYLQYFGLLANKSVDDILRDKKIINDSKFVISLFSELAVTMIFNADIILIEEKEDVKKIELARFLINKFNSNFRKDLIKMPQFFLLGFPKLMGLDGDKNLNDTNCLLLSDSQNIVRKKILTAKTDSDLVVRFDVKRKPQISNLINLYKLLTSETYDEIEDKFREEKYSNFKNDFIDQMNKFSKHFIKSQNDRNEIEKLLSKSHQKIGCELRRNMENIKKALGIFI